ncbi:hypothetical protein AB3R30_04550 [Leptolyngbyaceae cyanobacterium UHCC 1019]
MSLQKYSSPKLLKRRKNLWFERFMAIAAVTNLALVTFDLTYVPWRNFWLQGGIGIPLTNFKLHIPVPTIACRDRSVETGQPSRTIQQPVVTCLYDPIKGIEPHRDTQAYLDTVAQLESQLAQKGLEAGLKDIAVQDTLAKLRKLSTEMIETNPFGASGKSGALERIKNRIRSRVASRTNTRISAREAFNIFWSTDNPSYPNYLSPTTWNAEIDWFNQAIQPLIQTNYYRGVDENGNPTNHFWLLDAPFILLFFLEFLARTYHISRRYSNLTWLDAMIWRWYDIPLFIPFSLIAPTWALLRVLPTTLRLHQAEMINLENIQSRAREGFVSAIASEMVEVIIVQVINQAQGSIQRGELTNFLQRTTSRRYVDVNNINEIEAIATHMTHMMVHEVFPKIQPDLEALVRHSIETVMNQSPAYRGLQAIPGIGAVPAQITETLVHDVTQLIHNSLKTALDDPKTADLVVRFVRNFSSSFIQEAQQNNLQEMQSLLTDLLEEIKINYVQNLSEEDITLILDETRQLRQEAT